MERTLKIGDHVKVVDEHGALHDGLVTNQWNPDGVVIKEGHPPPAINVLFVSSDAEKTDPYGRQIERLSSCSHKTTTTTPGRY